MNGRPWLPGDTVILKRLAGKLTDAHIARITGHAEITVRKRRTELGLSPYAGRPGWSRRDYLLNSTAGLDFQISL